MGAKQMCRKVLYSNRPFRAMALTSAQVAALIETVDPLCFAQLQFGCIVSLALSLFLRPMEWWLLDREAIFWRVSHRGSGAKRARYEFVYISLETQKKDQNADGMRRCCTHGPMCKGSFDSPVLVLRPNGTLHPAFWCVPCMLRVTLRVSGNDIKSGPAFRDVQNAEQSLPYGWVTQELRKRRGDLQSAGDLPSEPLCLTQSGLRRTAVTNAAQDLQMTKQSSKFQARHEKDETHALYIEERDAQINAAKTISGFSLCAISPDIATAMGAEAAFTVPKWQSPDEFDLRKVLVPDDGVPEQRFLSPSTSPNAGESIPHGDACVAQVKELLGEGRVGLLQAFEQKYRCRFAFASSVLVERNTEEDMDNESEYHDDDDEEECERDESHVGDANAGLVDNDAQIADLGPFWKALVEARMHEKLPICCNERLQGKGTASFAAASEFAIWFEGTYSQRLSDVELTELLVHKVGYAHTRVRDAPIKAAIQIASVVQNSVVGPCSIVIASLANEVATLRQKIAAAPHPETAPPTEPIEAASPGVLQISRSLPDFAGVVTQFLKSGATVRIVE